MPKFIDCFLYHNEEQLLEIRLKLLNDYVDRFVIVCSKETFTGKKKGNCFPKSNAVFNSLKEKIDLVEVERLKGQTAWEKEAFSRNMLATKLDGLSEHDLVMISDIDEIPRPSVIKTLKEARSFNGMRVLELDYFNFKFNYKMFHGVQAIWAGPTICMFSEFTTPQNMRDKRWLSMANPETTIRDSGWHFSFLTDKKNVAEKLASFSHQEKNIQHRTDDISYLMKKRQGFHDHIHPGSIWGFIDISTFGCRELEELVLLYPALYETNLVDDLAYIDAQIKHSLRNVCYREREKILRLSSFSELCYEIKIRIIDRFATLRYKRK